MPAGPKLPGLRDGLARLSEGGVDLIVLDLSLPDSSGLATVIQVHAAAPGVPIVVLSGHNDDTLALEAVRLGAQDYLVKGQVTAGAGCPVRCDTRSSAIGCWHRSGVCRWWTS